MFIQIIKKKYYDRIGVSKRMDVNKAVDQKSVIFITIGISQIIVSTKCLR